MLDKIKITLTDSYGQTHTWMFHSWSEIGRKFHSGDKIKILTDKTKIIDGVFDKVVNGCISIRKEGSFELVSYPISGIMGVNKPVS